ncbi:MAG: HlyD family secretion protein [Nitrospinota bacterium]|nr:HlyD family secretion protein [Nitrospinota bacterium]
MKRSKFTIVFGVLFLLVLSCSSVYVWWINNRDFETTDNAYIKAPTVPITSRVKGIVQKVFVSEHEEVKKGDLLVQLEPKLFMISVEHAKAEVLVAENRYKSSKTKVKYEGDRFKPLVNERKSRLAMLEQTIKSANSFYQQKSNEVKISFLNLKRTKDLLLKNRKLFHHKIISSEILEEIVSKHEVDLATYKASLASRNVERNKIKALKEKMVELKASVSLIDKEKLSTKIQIEESLSLKGELGIARAKLKRTRLLLSYTSIRAPSGGTFSRKNIEVGSFVQPERSLGLIVPLKEIYVQANFKEVQVKNLRIGQKVDVIPDAYPNQTFVGRIQSFFSGTGDSFSLLPTENATGNWIKVMRRVPVKITLENQELKNMPLLIGMSVFVRVKVRDSSQSHISASNFKQEK